MRHLLAFHLLVLLVGLANSPVLAQVIDTTYISTDRQVMAMAREGNTIYIGGWFTAVGTATGGGVPLDPVTGDVIWPNPRVLGTIVSAVVADGGGGWYVGGNFSRVGGLSIRSLAHVLADGSVDSWDPQLVGSSGPPVVSALALSGTILYVAGNFQEAGGAARANLASFNLSTGAVTGWNPGANAPATCLAVGGNVVYAGGTFTQVGGASRNRLAALDATTGTARAWDALIPPYDGSFPLSVSSLALADDSLYVGGTFVTIGGATRRCVAQLRTSDGSATAWNPDAGDPGPNSVTAIAVDGDLVYLGGVFQTVGGQSRPNIAAIDATGAATAWNPNAGSQVTCLAIRGGVVYAGGAFQSIGGAVRNRLAALDVATGVATSWDPVPAPTSSVFALATSDNAVYAGGSFNFLRPTIRRRLAAFDAITHELLDWNPDADNQVDALVVRNGRVYVGGAFRNVGGVPRDRLAEIDAATGVPTSWAPAVDSRVSELALSGDTLFAAGSFQNIGAVPRSRLAAFNLATGSLLTRTFDANGQVAALLAVEGRIYAGGAFTTLGGIGKSSLAAIDPAAGVIPEWTADRNIGPVWSLAVSDGVLYSGGQFGGVAAMHLATGDTTDFRSTFECGTIEALAAGGSVVYVGGGCEDVVALHGGTGAPLPWGIPAGPNIRTMLLDGDGLFIGGGFSLGSGNSIQSGFVRLTQLDVTTATLGDFHAVRTREGVRLEWRVGRAASVRLERAQAQLGPWFELTLVPVDSDGLVRTVDDEAGSAELWYRLNVRFENGTTASFGPVRVPAVSMEEPRRGILAVSPNPTEGVVRINLAAAVRERVRVSLLDIAGREVDVLHDDHLEPGAHTFVWEARRGNAPLPAGVYFLSWRSSSRAEQRRIVITR